MTRKKYSLDFKKQVVKEVKETGSITAVARRYELSVNMVGRWKKEIETGKYGDVDFATLPSLDAETLSQENDQLKRLLGEKDLELAILRDLIKKKNPPLAEKLEVAEHYILQGYPKRLVLRFAQIPRSTYYYHKKQEGQPVEPVKSEGREAPGYSVQQDGTKVSDEQIKEWLMEAVAGDGFAYGYRKLTVLLRRQYELIINKKKVYRLCKELDILRPQRKKKTIYPRKLARNRVITDSNQLFETDIKYGYIEGEDRFFFIQSVLDIYDRSVIAYHMGLACEAKDVVRTLQQALLKRQLFDKDNKPAIRSDNGPQFISHAFEAACESFGVIHERIPPRTPNMNAHIESFHRILEDNCLSRHEFQSYKQAYETVVDFMTFYNERRIHSSIKDLAPNEFYRLNQEWSIKIKEIRV
ncbi:IS3 family transposase [Aneurinibacillus sp. Ricciae_BoGa-3]|uniref:IS3 family transposase n=1 Tax=Aneurinibacillus sp. Ricciae_BoGa-3 TaxID=3022697 RepID=UPI0023403029|nr:IS3 family transposase [Aneurinibacillus sp. Ricciae_BoGa-3]WCK52538.1 IS3 family transposase [Aneurinibacillus sp. Ricciae_BoGa-3]